MNIKLSQSLKLNYFNYFFNVPSILSDKCFQEFLWLLFIFSSRKRDGGNDV